MEFRIAATFTDSLARLTGDEQKAVKTTAFDLQVNAANPGMSFHKLDRARDKNFWSVRVSGDIRIIVHRSAGSLLLCYVDHHDKAYDWAERRRLETHPKTGAAQLVVIRETVQEIRVPQPVAAAKPPAQSQPLFAAWSDEALLGFGIPVDWLDTVRTSNEDSILDIAGLLPAEAAEALLELATGGQPHIRPGPERPSAVSVHADEFEGAFLIDESEEPQEIAGELTQKSFSHPDAQRRFRTIETPGELQRALDYPWDQWTIFLHPDQRTLIERHQSGPARVSGSAGTGKTVVALHRAVHLARIYPDRRVLLATYSQPLANALAIQLRRLVANEPRLAERIDVAALPTVGARLYRSLVGKLTLAIRAQVVAAVRESLAEVKDNVFGLTFLLSEWENVVDAWQLKAWDDYRDVVRLGRKIRLREDQRRTLWSVFEKVYGRLAASSVETEAGMFTRLAEALGSAQNPPYDFAVVDEAQDLSVSQIRFLAALGGGRPNSLFFAGDLGQRIFQQPFSWKALAVDVRGRSKTLRVNYRTSHQIRMQADRLLDREISDADGNTETRGDTISVFNGVPPAIQTFFSEELEINAVANWLRELAQESVAAHEIGIFVRSEEQLPRAKAAIERAGIAFKVLDERVESRGGFASIGVMHLAKGLEFRAAAVMACDDEVIPLQSRISAVGEEGDLKAVYETERHLLYVACTRARDRLMVSGVEPASEFVDDLRAGGERLHGASNPAPSSAG